ncbi:MAG: DUF5007 domain-containing protein [Chitinophagaceae bacterium]|nr:MAG: DUF5007 domain-containing protein [Chitinophagaceae bacterium]
MNTFINRLYTHVICIGIALAFVSCSKNLPESLDAFDKESVFTQTLYSPQLGRTTLMTSNFNGGNSTLPFTFEIAGIRRFDGSPAPELTESFPVKVWTTPYLGTETSLLEIEAKRATEYRPLFQVKKHSGEFVMWSNANSSFVRCSPDSSYKFDVLVKNSGGYAYTANMRLIPTREVDYEPNNIDSKSGLDTVGYVRPNIVTQMRAASNGFMILPQDIKVYFRQNDEFEGNAKTLTFRFFTSDYTAIDPARFNLTNWATLLHGFEMEKTAEYVRYKVAYPIPLVKTVSKYTNQNGDKARVRFDYNRIGASGFREESSMQFDFSIYKEKNWEIDMDISRKQFSFKDRILYWFEKKTGIRLFDFKNYRII